MWNEPSTERLARIPGLSETDNTPLKDKVVHLKFFFGGSNWLIFEHDGDDIFFGYVVLDNDYRMAEAGFISFNELRNINLDGYEIDCVLEEYWNYPTAKEVAEICRGMRWPYQP